MTTAMPDIAGTVDRPRTPFARLSVMMFLQYAVWGIWLPILAGYLGTPIAGGGLGFSGTQIGWILGLAGSIGAVTAPFLAGQLADRVMNAERALGMLLILGGAVNGLLATQTSYASWLVLSCVYSVLYMPTLALSNSIAFANLPDRERGFPPVRMFGTIGWIAASVAFPLVAMVTAVHGVAYWPFLDGTPRPDQTARIRYAIVASGAISVIYGAYALLVLPKTPPRPDARRPLAFRAAFGLLVGNRAGVVLMVAALLLSMVHQCYFFRTQPYLVAVGFEPAQAGSTMALGQLSEIVVLSLLGLFLSRANYKWVLALGALAYVAQFAIFAVRPGPALIYAAMLLHGLKYGLFFAGSFLLVEKMAPADLRHSAQTVYGISILGLGPILAGLFNQWMNGVAVGADGGFDYATFWWAQAGVAAAVLVLLTAAFPSGAGSPPSRAGTEG